MFAAIETLASTGNYGLINPSVGNEESRGEVTRPHNFVGAS